jgi:hypothetical protein
MQFERYMKLTNTLIASGVWLTLLHLLTNG